MKTRLSLVSNSSTSSFICDVCGAVESGQDACLSDVGMIRCENGHDFHENGCGKTKLPKIPEDATSTNEEGELLEAFCPICQMIAIPNNMVLDYLINKYDLKMNDVKNEMRKAKGK